MRGRWEQCNQARLGGCRHIRYRPRADHPGQGPLGAARGRCSGTAAIAELRLFHPCRSAIYQRRHRAPDPARRAWPRRQRRGCDAIHQPSVAGPFGQETRWYMQGPWAKGEKTQGFQSRMPPAEMYRAATTPMWRAINRALGRQIAAAIPPSPLGQGVRRPLSRRPGQTVEAARRGNRSTFGF